MYNSGGKTPFLGRGRVMTISAAWDEIEQPILKQTDPKKLVRFTILMA
jgi:hypothetical protein